MAYTQIELETMITEAKTALHTLMTNRTARVLVDYNGERVEFSIQTASRLEAYIQKLQTQLDALTNARQISPARFFF